VDYTWKPLGPVRDAAREVSGWVGADTQVTGTWPMRYVLVAPIEVPVTFA
jgi:hypothetical protein